MLTTEDLRRALVHQERRAAQAEQLATTLAAVGAAPNLDTALAALARGAVTLCGGVEGGVRLFGDEIHDHGDQHDHARGKTEDHRGFWVGHDGSLIRAYFAAPPSGSVSAALRDGAPSRLIYDLLAL